MVEGSPKYTSSTDELEERRLQLSTCRETAARGHYDFNSQERGDKADL